MTLEESNKRVMEIHEMLKKKGADQNSSGLTIMMLWDDIELTDIVMSKLNKMSQDEKDRMTIQDVEDLVLTEEHKIHKARYSQKNR